MKYNIYLHCVPLLELSSKESISRIKLCLRGVRKGTTGGQQLPSHHVQVIVQLTVFSAQQDNNNNNSITFDAYCFSNLVHLPEQRSLSLNNTRAISAQVCIF